MRPSQRLSLEINSLAAVSQFDVGVYAQDDWKARPNLTMNFGLRYENQDNISSNYNFAPRIGFAWGVGGGQQPKTVVRGGFGIFYNPAGNEGSSLRLFRQLPFGSTVTISPGDINVGLRVSDGFLPLQPPNFADANKPYGGMFAAAANFRDRGAGGEEPMQAGAHLRRAPQCHA